MTLTILILTAVSFFILRVLLALSINQRDDNSNKTKTIASNTLTYTDQELYAIEILNANKGKRLTVNELGCSTITLYCLRRKQYKLKKGELVNKNRLPTFNIVRQEDSNGITRYGIRK